MKKIISLLFVLLVVLLFTGCEKKDNNEEVVKEIKVKEKYNYYVSTVAYVNHDDYYIKENTVNYPVKTLLKEEPNVATLNIDVKEQEITQLNDISNIEIKDDSKEEDTSDINTEEASITKNNEGVKEETIKEEPIKGEVIKEEPKEELKKDDLIINEETNENKDSNTINDASIKEPIDNLNVTNEIPQNKPGYYGLNGQYLGTTNVKVIDVSYYQGIVDWDKFKSDSDCYGVILRLGYYKTIDKMFERNISELKRLGIPYGIYLFSYSTTLNGAKIESDFTNQMIDKYNLEPTLGIYYDIEGWNTKNSSSNNITKTRYDEIVQLYVNSVSSHVMYKYKVKVYSGRWYAMNRLGSIAKSYVDWVAEYNSTCRYDGNYSMWQYTSKGRVPGINGNVDISYIINK